MKLLLVLLSVMTWIVDSKNTVHGEGTGPYSIDVSYSCSYQKGTVRAGDEAVLTLTQLGGITVEQVEVWVKSNKDAGAGTFTVTMNGQETATKEGSLKDWCGRFDNEEYHPVQLLSEKREGVNALSIRLTGTTNSLHIDKYVITYSVGSPHTVTLMTGARSYQQLTETKGGEGVVLPNVNDTADWVFVGWSATEFWEMSVLPTIYNANATFYPSADCTLWAVYQLKPESSPAFVTDLISGEYLYMNRDNNLALTGVPTDGVMTSAKANPANANQVYTIIFTSARDTAYITHKASGTPIGYSGKKMSAIASPWLVYHNGEETLFYARIDYKNYVLWLNIIDAGNEGQYAGLLLADPMTSAMRLLPASHDTKSYYSCHPETKSLEEARPVYMNGERVLMRFGNYEMVIVNGRKVLRIKN